LQVDNQVAKSSDIAPLGAATHHRYRLNWARPQQRGHARTYDHGLLRDVHYRINAHVRTGTFQLRYTAGTVLGEPGPVIRSTLHAISWKQCTSPTTGGRSYCPVILSMGRNVRRPTKAAHKSEAMRVQDKRRTYLQLCVYDWSSLRVRIYTVGISCRHGPFSAPWMRPRLDERIGKKNTVSEFL
jgi:hypothetical protein